MPAAHDRSYSRAGLRRPQGWIQGLAEEANSCMGSYPPHKRAGCVCHKKLRIRTSFREQNGHATADGFRTSVSFHRERLPFVDRTSPSFYPLQDFACGAPSALQLPINVIIAQNYRCGFGVSSSTRFQAHIHSLQCVGVWVGVGLKCLNL